MSFYQIWLLGAMVASVIYVFWRRTAEFKKAWPTPADRAYIAICIFICSWVSVILMLLLLALQRLTGIPNESATD